MDIIFFYLFMPKTMKNNNLAFRRQFLLSNCPLKKISDWQSNNISVKDFTLYLYTHSDLEVTKAEYLNNQLILLGYIMDPYNPGLSNADIANNNVRNKNLEELFNNIHKYNGRFIIIYTNNEQTVIFHDAIGFREIYYYLSDNILLCGSTPSIINEFTDEILDDEVSINEFLNSSVYRETTLWIGTNTPYKNLYHLLPNHYLDLKKKSIHRYWPNKPKQTIHLKEGARKIADILKGTMLAACTRYQLEQAITSGYDSRLLLAASKDITSKIKFCVNRVGALNERSPDIFVPVKIAKQFNLDFKVIDAREIIVDTVFKKIYYCNNTFARDRHLNTFYDVYQRNHENKYWVTGTVGNEILRIACPLNNKKISASDIARRFNYDNYTYAVNSIAKWLEDARPVCEKYGYNIMNLFFWEQYVCSLDNLSASEQDIVREEIRPFNSRDLLTTYLSLKNKYRYKDNPKGHTEATKLLWRDLTKIPYFHASKSSDRIKKIFRFLGIELFVDNLYYFLKNNFYYRKAFIFNPIKILRN
jgi:hypothetical protein